MGIFLRSRQDIWKQRSFGINLNKLYYELADMTKLNDTKIVAEAKVHAIMTPTEAFVKIWVNRKGCWSMSKYISILQRFEKEK